MEQLHKLDPVIVNYGKTHKKEYKAIYRAIERYDRIVVFRHIKPDFDAMGTQMGLYLAQGQLPEERDPLCRR
jgi:nanoRNase/pAp phosphatase (c-di-AMP/oligoRNAs hydrolase)